MKQSSEYTLSRTLRDSAVRHSGHDGVKLLRDTPLWVMRSLKRLSWHLGLDLCRIFMLKSHHHWRFPYITLARDPKQCVGWTMECENTVATTAAAAARKPFLITCYAGSMERPARAATILRDQRASRGPVAQPCKQMLQNEAHTSRKKTKTIAHRVGQACARLMWNWLQNRETRHSTNKQHSCYGCGIQRTYIYIYIYKTKKRAWNRQVPYGPAKG